MRLWDYRLIPILPNAQLKAMRYEIGDMIIQYPNIKNGLVKYANDYDIKYLYSYFQDVLDEFDKRGINHNKNYDDNIEKIVKAKSHFQFSYLNLYYEEHNDRYLRQNLYNLEEKAMRGIINKEEWEIIYNNFKDFTDLWKGE